MDILNLGQTNIYSVFLSGLTLMNFSFMHRRSRLKSRTTPTGQHQQACDIHCTCKRTICIGMYFLILSSLFCPLYTCTCTCYNTSIKNNRLKLKDEVGMAGSKSTQTRDNRIYYTSLRLLYSTIMHLLANVDVFVECGMWEIFRLFPSCHNDKSLSVLIQSYYYWLF